jgi:hypothetical protein
VPGESFSGEVCEPGERRQAARLDKVFPVFVEGDGGAGLGIARNISEGGMFVETRDPQPLGTQVRVTFPARDGEMIAVAEVRYVCHLIGRLPDAGETPRHGAIRGMGVRFLYFEPDGAPPPMVH